MSKLGTSKGGYISTRKKKTVFFYASKVRTILELLYLQMTSENMLYPFLV